MIKDESSERLDFNSKEYWALGAAEHLEFNEVLALWANIKFIWKNKLWEVFGKNL